MLLWKNGIRNCENDLDMERSVSDISFFFHGTDFKCSKLNDGGRGIRRLVCLSERVEDLIAEFDRRILLGANDESEADSMDSTDPL